MSLSGYSPIYDNAGILFEVLKSKPPHSNKDVPEALLSLMNTAVVIFLQWDSIKKCKLVCRRWWVDLHTRTQLRLLYPPAASFNIHFRPKLWSCILYGEEPQYFPLPVDYWKAYTQAEKIVPESTKSDIIKDVLRTFSCHPVFLNTSPSYSNHQPLSHG
eukprot:Gregarina_sp_Poly_1__8779@NODE_526_length_7686_cov_239_700617_g417_i0_p6_GENE_NODE_526_length_7686_cov_239_700617_g417_i0NODE_526_length_7686_cov_239_700617_g417_i0_p6_ORF_typecomplete_len159_score12_72_NODE_526_length_7686_cov_239_700617_g417_i018132289